MALTRPNNFENSSKWTTFNRYTQFVTETLKPYINIQTTPPYYQGSYSIFNTTQQNKANSFNLSNQPDGLGISSTANVNLASPLPKPGPEGTKLSELTPEEYRTAEIRKPINFGKETTIQKIGAIIPIGTTLNDDTISNLDRALKYKNLYEMTEFFTKNFSPHQNIEELFSGYAITQNTINRIKHNSLIYSSIDDPCIPIEPLLKLNQTDYVKFMPQQYGGHCGFIDDFKFSSSLYDEIVYILNTDRV